MQEPAREPAPDDETPPDGERSARFDRHIELR